MLRLWVLLLVLLNGAYFAWGQGWLAAYGWGPKSQREPQRLSQQIRPESVRLLSKQELAQTLQVNEAEKKDDANPSVCLMSKPLDAAQVKALQEVLHSTLPTTAWSWQEAPMAELWIVYMGKYPSVDDLDKKRLQLSALKIPFEVLSDDALAPGLSLGQFDSQTAATKALDALLARGVKTARVLQRQVAGFGARLRLPEVNAALAEKLAPVRAALGASSLLPCVDNPEMKSGR